MTESETSATRDASGRTTFLAWLLASAIASPFCFNAVQESDIGWHLALGRIIVTQHAIPRTNLLSWTTPKYPYYATSWLFDVVAHFMTVAFGIAGVQLLMCLLLLLTLAGAVIACRQLDRLGPWLVPAMALLLVPRVMPRPHMMSWVVEAWTLALCLIGRDRGWRWRAGCVFLVALGSNAHAGAIFSDGVLGLFCLEAAWKERRWGREALICIGGGLALIANPGFLYNVLYAFGNLSVYKQLPVEEMKPPLIADLPAFFVMIPVTLLAGWAQRKRRPVMLPLTIVFAVLGLFAVRLAFIFYLVAMPVLAGALSTLRHRSGARAVGLSFALLMTLAAATMISRVAHLSPRLDWNESVLPVRAARYIAHRGLDGRHFNSFEDGGYLEYALPNLKAYQDGRVQAYPPAFFAHEVDASLDPASFRAYLRRQGVEWALATSSKYGLSGNGMFQSPDWALVYWDDASEVYVRRDVPRWAGLIARDEYRYFVPTTSPEELVTRAGALPRVEVQRLDAEATRFASIVPDTPAALLVRCAARTRLKLADAGAVCQTAAQASSASDWQRLVAKARSLSPAS